jgi:putative acetyltransferase
MSFLPGFDLRFTESSDLEPLKKWFEPEGSFDDYPFDASESEEALKNWIGFCKYKASLTATLDGVPCAVGTLFLMPYRKVAHHCSFFLMVDPSHRRKGIGTSMVRNLLHLARTRFKLESLHVEVYEPSHLLPILEKLQFKLFARQEDYMRIQDCPRARILMEHFFL